MNFLVASRCLNFDFQRAIFKIFDLKQILLPCKDVSTVNMYANTTEASFVPKIKNPNSHDIPRMKNRKIEKVKFFVFAFLCD